MLRVRERVLQKHLKNKGIFMLFVENYFWLNDLKLVRIAVSLLLRIVIINQDYRKKNPVV